MKIEIILEYFEITKKIKIQELKEIISKLGNKKQAGEDRVVNEVFKIMIHNEQFQDILLKILNTCIEKETIPDNWRQSNIFMIYKKNDPNESLNYRPIALLNSIYKLYTLCLT